MLNLKDVPANYYSLKESLLFQGFKVQKKKTLFETILMIFS